MYAREQVLPNEYPNAVLFPLLAMRIGSGIISELGGEFFAETGLSLKKRLEQNISQKQWANGYFGYVPPTHEMERGRYETRRCHTSFLNSESEIRNKLLALIQGL